MKERSLSRCQCDYCGTYYALNYDDQNCQYICDDCLHAENAEAIAELEEEYGQRDEITNDEWTRMVL